MDETQAEPGIGRRAARVVVWGLGAVILVTAATDDRRLLLIVPLAVAFAYVMVAVRTLYPAANLPARTLPHVVLWRGASSLGRSLATPSPTARRVRAGTVCVLLPWLLGIWSPSSVAWRDVSDVLSVALWIAVVPLALPILLRRSSRPALRVEAGASIALLALVALVAVAIT